MKRDRVYLDDRLMRPRDWVGVVIPLAFIFAAVLIAIFHNCGVL